MQNSHTNDDSDAELHLVWAHFMSWLDIYRKRVAENRDVDTAVQFARHVLNSRLCRLCEIHARDDFWKIDGALLRHQARELEQACTERYRTRDVEPRLSQLQLQSIDEKLGAIAGEVARLAGEIARQSGKTAELAAVGTKPLEVFDGGLAGGAA